MKIAVAERRRAVRWVLTEGKLALLLAPMGEEPGPGLGMASARTLLK
ncbi:hypothetical protein [Granulicella sp. S190]|nr:hypothetical protein [Granulicella sp. S190]